MAEFTAVAFVPARSGSVRVKDKNIRPLMGHPLMAYSICATRQSGLFEAVVVSTDSETYADIARHYGAEVLMRPAELASTTSPDIDWVLHALGALGDQGRLPDAFAILRPTSPFRKPQTIQRAWGEFLAADGADSLRAVEKVSQHPGKMWIVDGARMRPLLPQPEEGPPWHSRQMPSLPVVHVQNASLEIAWTRMALETRTIAGAEIVPFLTEGDEGMDINQPYDWFWAEQEIAEGRARLPEIDRPPYAG
jgi:CMP-N,N'-diacetyllegionaminic acid synthase